MMTLHLSIVADVFSDEAQAKHALEALRQAGFDYDQIGIAMQGHEGIDLLSDLQNLGVSHEQASYYAQEVQAGHTVVSVRPDGREQEAHEIMHRSGAFTDAESGAASQPSDIDKQKAAWEQAVASQQAYLAEQRASKTQEDFHRPRSLKPRADRVQTEEAALRSDMPTEQKSRGPVEHQNEVNEQKLVLPPLAQEAVGTKQASGVAPVVQNETVCEQFPLPEDEYRETIAIDDEETLRRLRKQESDRAEVLVPPTQMEQPSNRNLLLLLGGLLLGLSAGVLVALLQRKQIRQFILSTTRTLRT